MTRLTHCTPTLGGHFPLCDRNGRYCSDDPAHSGPCHPHGTPPGSRTIYPLSAGRLDADHLADYLESVLGGRQPAAARKVLDDYRERRRSIHEAETAPDGRRCEICGALPEEHDD
jgi:hypothetical protein